MQKYVSVSGGSRHARLKLFGYYVQRACTSRTLRRIATRALVAGLRVLHGPPARAIRDDGLALERMRVQGYLRMGALLSGDQCAQALAYLRHQDMIPARRARLMLIVQYSLLPCLIYDYAPVAYPGHDRYDAHVNRLMLATGAGRGTVPLADDVPRHSLQD